MPRRNRMRERQAEDARADQVGDPHDAVVGALQLTLLGGRHAARHQPLRGRPGKAPQRHHGQSEQEHRAGRGKPEHRQAGGAEQEPDQQCAPLAEPVHHRADQAGLHDHRAYAERRHGEPDHLLVPAIAIAGVEHEHAREHDVREVDEKVRGRKPEQLSDASASSLSEPSGLARRQANAPRCRAERLRQHEHAVQRVGETEGGRDPERQARLDRTQHARRAQGRARSPCRTPHPACRTTWRAAPAA